VCFAVLGAVLVAVVVPVARTVLVRLPKFADIAPLALPIAIQPAIYLVQLPFAAALRGMHRARLLFFQYLAFTGTSLTGLVIGAPTELTRLIARAAYARGVTRVRLSRSQSKVGRHGESKLLIRGRFSSAYQITRGSAA